MFQDGSLVLTGSLFASTSDHGLVERIGFGEISTWAYGTSEWESFTHNAAVIPEPSTLTLVALSSLALVLVRRGR